MSNRVLITGANGHLGRRLIERLRADHEIVAVVRSRRAAALLDGVATDVRILDYADASALSEAAAGCGAAVHLVGIIKEGARSSFHDAHEATTRALESLDGLERIVYLSILGAAVDSNNACLASKAAAENILLSGRTPAVVVRVAMVLGEGDYASVALAKRASRRLGLTFRAASMEQPIYAGDVIDAIVAALDWSGGDVTLNLAGPERLTRRALTQRAASILGKRSLLFSLPLVVGRAMASVFERTLANPPVTRAMLGVLDHDDNVDVARACERLSLDLTSLDETLRLCLGRDPG